MKTYKLFTEGIKKWKDVKSPAVKKEAGHLLKALDRGEVLAYSGEHDEFSTFKNEKELEKAKKGTGKKMRWVKVESTMSEAFDFKGAVKHGFLDKYDEKYVKELEKRGWDIQEFILTGKGFEIAIKKGSTKMEFTDKTPEKVLQQAAKKAK